jgi:type I restriction-modification system DNA methylase subunit
LADPNLSSFIWSVADLLRGDYKQSDYGKVILPFTVLRRLDCVLESTKQAVLDEFAARTKAGLNPGPFLLDLPRFRGRFRGWDSSGVLQRHPPLVVDG